MLHTIQADFYRLFRSKGFWITEAILIFNILSGVIFGASGHVVVITESKLPQATEVWTGFKALTNYSASICQKCRCPDHCSFPIPRFLWSRLLDRDPLQWTWDHA